MSQSEEKGKAQYVLLKLPCKECSKEMRVSTYQKNDGICLKCRTKKKKEIEEEKNKKRPCQKCAKEMSRETYEKNSGICIHCQKVDKKERQERVKLSKKERLMVWDKIFQRHRCGLCPVCHLNDISMENFVVGHITSLAMGGKNEHDNYMPICAQCNLEMGPENIFDYAEKIKMKREDLYSALMSRMMTMVEMYTTKMQELRGEGLKK